MDIDTPRLIIHLLGGVVFSLSGFVIYKHIKRWQANKRYSLLPFHVWTIALSYDLLVLSLMTRIPRGDWAFVFGCTGLLLGICSLSILVRFQIKNSKN